MGERSDAVRARVEAARALAMARVKGRGERLEIISEDTDTAALRLLERAVDALGLSVRAYTKVLRVGRTIADLEGSARVEEAHVAEAIQYRLLDRARVEGGWACGLGDAPSCLRRIPMSSARSVQPVQSPERRVASRSC